jgi:hypothetical protein
VQEPSQVHDVSKYEGTNGSNGRYGRLNSEERKRERMEGIKVERRQKEGNEWKFKLYNKKRREKKSKRGWRKKYVKIIFRTNS